MRAVLHSVITNAVSDRERDHMVDRTNFAPAAIGACLEIQDGSEWYHLAGAASFSASGGDAPTSEQRNFKGVALTAGFPGVPTITVTLDPMSPMTWIAQQLRKDPTKRRAYRLRTNASEVIAGNDFGSNAKVEVAALGSGKFSVATLSDHAGPVDFEDGRLQIGHLIRTGTGNSERFFRIEELLTPTTLSVSEGEGKGATSALGKTDISAVIQPGLQDVFTATVSSGTGYELPSGGALTQTLTLAPSGALGNWTESTEIK